MGTVKSRHQAGGDTGWQQTMMSSSSSSVVSKRRKLGVSSHQDRDRARDPRPPLTGHVHVSVSHRRKDHAGDSGTVLPSAGGQHHHDSLTPVPPSSSCSSSNSRLCAASAGGLFPASSSVDGGRCSCSSQACSHGDSAGYNCQCRRHRCSSSSSRQLENVLFSQQFNLDTHPAVTCLQNEQNLRLEGMEQRMDKIRKNAQQEAERRKFAHLFRARTEEKLKAETLLKEAGVALQVFKKERQQKKSKREKPLLSLEGTDTQNQFVVTEAGETQENDRGEIIPVQIVSASNSSTVSDDAQQAGSKAEAPLNWLLQPVERLELNGVVLWLVLPFLLPLLLLLHLLRHLSPSSDCHHGSKKH